MKTIYLDSDFKCHMADPGTGKTVETDDFNERCDAFIEGCRFIPAGESWTREDGEVFRGEAFFPWKDDRELEQAQRLYEQEKLAEYETLINELYEEVV